MYQLSVVAVKRKTGLTKRDNRSTKDEVGKAAKKGVEVSIQGSDRRRTQLDNLKKLTMRFAVVNAAFRRKIIIIRNYDKRQKVNLMVVGWWPSI